jgi:hypothetical protein
MRKVTPLSTQTADREENSMYQTKLKVSLMLLLLTLTLPTLAHTPPADARVFFIDLKDAAVVQSPFKVRFGIEGFGITPAGTTGKIRHTAGHFHLLVDLDRQPDLDAPIPRDQNHLHFDDGETEAMLTLPPGRHSLQLLLGDEDHEPQDPPLLSSKITITVE